MNNKRWFTLHITTLLLLIIGVVPKESVNAQELSIELEASPTLENAQVLSLTNLGIDSKGSGPVLISGFVENLSGQRLDNLYFKVTITADKVGPIVELTQQANRPFSLEAGGTVYATNNDLANEAIPGIEETIRFDGGLTPEGDNLIENLNGTSLPRDIYTVMVSVFRETDAEGTKTLGEDAIEIGGGLFASFDESEVYLKTPGDVVGSEAEITNRYPQFNWEGASNVSYRLLVVEDNGQDSPESLLQSAKSSSPMSEGGSLLEFENLDVLVDGTSFQYPSSGAQPLESGNSYYWRVVTTVQASGDTEEISSEIWNFTLLEISQTSSGIVISDELEQALIELMGAEEFQRLEESGFDLEGIEYDGQEFTGQAAIVKLEELLQKVRDEEIIIGEN